MQRLHLALLAVFLAGAGYLLVERRAEPRAPEAASGPALLDVALPEAALVATLDLEALSASAWGRALLARALELAAPGGEAGGCESRLLARLRRVALSVPRSSSAAAALDFGVIAEGSARSADVLPCAESAMRRRGAAPVTARLGDFTLLRDRRGHGELAVRDDGQLILSGGAAFRDLVDRSAGRLAAEGLEARIHRALRERVGGGPLVVTAVLPPGWLERWLEDPDVAASPLADLRAVAIRGDTSPGLRLKAIARTEDEAAAVRLERFLHAARADFGPLLASLVDAAPPREPRIERRGEEIAVELELEGAP